MCIWLQTATLHRSHAAAGGSSWRSRQRRQHALPSHASLASQPAGKVGALTKGAQAGQRVLADLWVAELGAAYHTLVQRHVPVLRNNRARCAIV